jgi:hypothetical protein
MKDQEERYIHFMNCIQSLNEALRILKSIKQESGNPLVGPAFKFALILYSKPYTTARGNIKARYSLGLEHVPTEHQELHKEILAARHQILAHSDLTVEDAQIYVFENKNGRYVGVSKNIIDGTEKLRRINDIIDLIEKTLDSMYSKEKELKANLQPSMIE